MFLRSRQAIVRIFQEDTQLMK